MLCLCGGGGGSRKRLPPWSCLVAFRFDNIVFGGGYNAVCGKGYQKDEQENDRSSKVSELEDWLESMGGDPCLRYRSHGGVKVWVNAG